MADTEATPRVGSGRSSLRREADCKHGECVTIHEGHTRWRAMIETVRQTTRYTQSR